MNADEIEIRKLVADWMAATKSGDIDAVLAMMTDDAIFLTAGNPPMTKQAFANIAKAQAAPAGVEIDGTSDIKEVQIAGDWAFLWSHLHVRMKAPEAQAVERTGHTLTVFHKVSGKWLLARDANLLVVSQPPQG